MYNRDYPESNTEISSIVTLAGNSEIFIRVWKNFCDGIPDTMRNGRRLSE
jgi:hypothetical protein